MAIKVSILKKTLKRAKPEGIAHTGQREIYSGVFSSEFDEGVDAETFLLVIWKSFTSLSCRLIKQPFENSFWFELN